MFEKSIILPISHSIKGLKRILDGIEILEINAPLKDKIE